MLPPTLFGSLEPYRGVTSPEGDYFRWKTVSFWRSRLGFYDENNRLVVEFALAGGGIWIRQDPERSPYLPMLLFAGILTLRTRPR
jgi:hypothetical protein